MKESSVDIAKDELIMELNATILSLNSTIESLTKQLDELRVQNGELNGRNKYLLEQVSGLQGKIDELLGKLSSMEAANKDLQEKLNSLLTEKFKSSTEKKAAKKAGQEKTVKTERKPSERKENDDLSTLPSGTPVVDVYEKPAVTVCGACGKQLEQVGETISLKVAWRRYRVLLRIHRPTMKCMNCDAGVAKQSSPDMLDGTIADASLVASTVVGWVGKGLPLYRQEDELFSRQLLSKWIIRTGERIAYNLIPMLEKALNGYALLNVDETGMKVVLLNDEEGKPKGRDSRRNAWMVVMVATGRDGTPGPVLFKYTQGRSGAKLTELIGDYHGCLQTDGLQSYSIVDKNLDLEDKLGCLVHACRKAKEAARELTEGPAVELVDLYQDMFGADKALRKAYKDGEIDEGTFLEKRKSDVLPLLEKIRDFCQKLTDAEIPPEKKLGTAARYYLDRYKELAGFIKYSFAGPENSAAERAIRDYVIGRKNSLFSFTERGAEVSAAFYSLVESCRRMNIDPELYLTHLFMNGNAVKDGDEAGWEALLPWKSDLKDAKEHMELIISAKSDPKRTTDYVLRGTRR